MLVSRVGVHGDAAARASDRLDDGDVTRPAPVHVLDPAQLGLDGGTVARPHDGRRGDVAHQKPGSRDVERVGDRRQYRQRWGCLVVLDLRQVADVDAAQGRDLCQRPPPDDAPTPDLRSDREPGLGVRRAARCHIHGVCPHQTAIDISIALGYRCTSN